MTDQTDHPPHVQRMFAERDELADRTLKLSQFFDTAAFTALKGLEKDLLRAQFHAMGTYHTILNTRLGMAIGITG